MTIKINGKVDKKLEQALLKIIESNRKQRIEVFQKIECQDNILTILIEFYKDNTR